MTYDNIKSRKKPGLDAPAVLGLNMEDITYADYEHTKKDCKDFEITNLGEYRDLYVQSNTLLLAYVFENFQNMCLEIYEPDPAKFL